MAAFSFYVEADVVFAGGIKARPCLGHFLTQHSICADDLRSLGAPAARRLGLVEIDDEKMIANGIDMPIVNVRLCRLYNVPRGLNEGR